MDASADTEYRDILAEASKFLIPSSAYYYVQFKIIQDLGNLASYFSSILSDTFSLGNGR